MIPDRRNILRAAMLATAFPLLAACASGPTFSEMHASEPAVKPEKGRIYFYRVSSMMGSGVQPPIRVNGEVVGMAIPGGYFYVDRDPGAYDIATATETTESIKATIKAGEIRYVRLDISMGVMVGRVAPTLVMAEQGEPEIAKCHYAPELPGERRKKKEEEKKKRERS
jgi:hypothetical protein